MVWQGRNTSAGVGGPSRDLSQRGPRLRPHSKLVGFSSQRTISLHTALLKYVGFVLALK